MRRGRNGRAFFSGLETCGSVWECAVCSQRVSMHRAEQIRELLRLCREQGGEAYMLTRTVPHDQGDRLVDVKRIVADAWRFGQSGKPWRKQQVRLGLAGRVRALEVTVGEHGWHPHLHILLICERALGDPADSEVLLEFVAWVCERWRH